MCVAWWQKEKLQFSSMLDKWRQNNPTNSCCHLNFMFRLVDTKLKPDGYLEVIQHTTLSGGSFDFSCSMSYAPYPLLGFAMGLCLQDPSSVPAQIP